MAVNSRTAGSSRTAPDGTNVRYYAPPERRARQIFRAQTLPPLFSFSPGGQVLQRERTLQALRDPRAVQFLQVLPDPREAAV